MGVAVAATFLWALIGPAGGTGILPPANPAANLAWSAANCAATGSATPNSAADCLAVGVSQINAGRAAEGVRPLYLPSDYLSLTPAQQIFVVTNLERVDRGLPPVQGMAAELNTLSAQGAGHGTDPPFPSGRAWAGGVWAGGYASTLEAVFGWVYDDGPGSPNAACLLPGDTGCWGHRDIILTSNGGSSLVGGAATGLGTWGTEYAALFVQYQGQSPAFVYSWSDAVAHGAGVAGATAPAQSGDSSAGTPPSRPAGWPVPTRLAGGDRDDTAIAVSQNTWAARSSLGSHPGGVVLARDDQFPDALASVPLAAAVHGPLLLSGPAGLDPRDLTEINRILAPGATVYLIGGQAALSDAVAQTLSAAGYAVSRVAGGDRFETAVAIAHALGDPATVLEVSGDTFADALAAGPSAAAANGVVLLTDGSVMPPSTAGYVAHHAQQVWAVGGPASAADPSATAIVGGDRYQTAALVASQFVSSPSVIGVATGSSFPDALAAGAQLAQGLGALLLVRPDSVPDATAGYINAHQGVPMLLYGGVGAVTSLVAGIL